MKVYILKDRRVVPATLEEWAAYFATADRSVAQWIFGDVHVSTVFLGLDHNWSDEGPPLLYETMVFGGLMDGVQERSSTWTEAEQTHERVCREVRLGVLQ